MKGVKHHGPNVARRVNGWAHYLLLPFHLGSRSPLSLSLSLVSKFSIFLPFLEPRHSNRTVSSVHLILLFSLSLCFDVPFRRVKLCVVN